MLLRQPDMHFDEVEHPNDLVTDWDGTEDMPEPWKKMVDRCMSLDPTERPDVLELLQFWQDQLVGLKTKVERLVS